MKLRLYTTCLAALLVLPMLGCTVPHSLEQVDTTANLGLPGQRTAAQSCCSQPFSAWTTNFPRGPTVYAGAGWALTTCQSSFSQKSTTPPCSRGTF